MTTEEMNLLMGALSPEDRIDFENDKIVYGAQYLKLVDGKPIRIDPKDISPTMYGRATFRFEIKCKKASSAYIGRPTFVKTSGILGTKGHFTLNMKGLPMGEIVDWRPGFLIGEVIDQPGFKITRRKL